TASATVACAATGADGRALLAQRQDLGGGAHRDRAGFLAGQARRGADRAGDARESPVLVTAAAALRKPARELRALRRRADEPDVREVVALERLLDDREVERVVVRRHDDERSAWRVGDL